MRAIRKLYYKLIALEWRRKRRRERRRRRALRIAEALAGRYGLSVQQGPFAGMAYPEAAAKGSELIPKLIGSYERELHPVLERLRQRGHTRIVNVGCGEGYYAVGMARLMPAVHVYAFDCDEAAEKQCLETARINGVADRVTVEGCCSIDRLRELTAEPALILCDCEGCEADLLRPDLVPGLAACDLLVELHAGIAGSAIKPAILSRFAATHRAELMRYRERPPAEYPALAFLPRSDQKFALDEYRTRALEWVYLERK